MNAVIAYIDSSALLRCFFEEAGYRQSIKLLSDYSMVVSSDLIISESFSACKREKLDLKKIQKILNGLIILHPEIDQSLVEKCLKFDYLRGADCHHLATALWFAGERVSDLAFITTDEKQKAAAEKLGFS